MINYLIHSDGRKEFIGKPVSVVYNYVPANAPIIPRVAATMKIGPKRVKHPKCPLHRFPCMLYYFQFSNNGWNALPGKWNVSLRMLEGD